MRRSRPVALFFALALLLAPPAVRAAEPEWHSEQPVAAGIGVPVPIGQIGDISFWAPNRGVLITAGNNGVPGGIYAYDGTGWYLYSTVCGGHEGSIAWAGPDEFWTVSDYAEAQEGNTDQNRISEYRRTLCHFKDGEVVASYAEPLVSPNVYSQMNAAVCAGPNNCWFAGERLSETAANQDPFHLHWDGSSLTAVPSPVSIEPELAQLPGKAVDLAFNAGHLYESASEAPLLREVVPADPRRFLPVELPPSSGTQFQLSTDPEQRKLWAADQEGVVLRSGTSGFETVFPGGTELFPGRGIHGMVEAVGAEAGGASAWLGGGESKAFLRRVGNGGSIGPVITLPQPWEELSDKGGAAQIACAGVNQCWMATTEGWLFHFGGPLAPNNDPLMHRLITVRPTDASSRSFVPAGMPEDNSGEVEPNALGEPPVGGKFPKPRKQRAIVVGVKQKVIHKTVLQLSFTLRAKAHVRLVAKRRKAVVAETPRQTLGKGRHRLRLHLDPKRWPTSLDFQVHAAGGQAKK